MLAYCGRMNLIATRVPRATCSPDQTVPIPPDPIISRTRYLPPTIDPSRDGELVVGEIIDPPGARDSFHTTRERRPGRVLAYLSLRTGGDGHGLLARSSACIASKFRGSMPRSVDSVRAKTRNEIGSSKTRPGAARPGGRTRSGTERSKR